VVAYDPMPTARERAVGIVPGLDVVDNALDAVEGADIAVLVTEWPEFLDLEWNSVGALMRRRIVIDGRNVLSGEELASSGFLYSSFGRGTFLGDGAGSWIPSAGFAMSPMLQVGEG